MFFPSLFDDATARNVDSFRLKRVRALCEMILEGKEESKEVDDIDLYFLGLIKPKTFSGSQSYEVQFELNYEALCHSLAEHSNGREIKTMSVLEVYSLMLLVKKKNLKDGGRFN